MGGLGNQLFQVAAAYAYSRKYSTELFLDDSEWCGGQGKSGAEYKHNIFKNFTFDDMYPRSVLLHEEKEFNYVEISRPPVYKPCMKLFGYFQSLKYFEDFQDDFKKLLNLTEVDSSFIQKKNVAFHIRRGDYLHYKDIHYVCDSKYFDKCFDIFKDYEINVFTDSPEHVLEEFKDHEFNLIKTSSELNDLTLISLHDNVVCSNSTFSWWGSFLGKTKERVLVPSKWFNDGREHEDIYRKEMIKLDV
jgi:hypothetical protein